MDKKERLKSLWADPAFREKMREAQKHKRPRRKKVVIVEEQKKKEERKARKARKQAAREYIEEIHKNNHKVEVNTIWQSCDYCHEVKLLSDLTVKDRGLFKVYVCDDCLRLESNLNPPMESGPEAKPEPESEKEAELKASSPPEDPGSKGQMNLF